MSARPQSPVGAGARPNFMEQLAVTVTPEDWIMVSLLEGQDPSMGQSSTRMDSQMQQQPANSSGPTRRHYAPTDPSILGDNFDSLRAIIPPLLGGTRIQGQPRASSGSMLATSGMGNNPYAAIVEARQHAMTIRYLRSLESSSAVRDRPAVPANDSGFGQRYQRVAAGESVVVTNCRVPTAVLSGQRECVVCAETLPVARFPGLAVSRNCDHPPSTCLDCVAASIRSDLGSRLWNQIRCPECRAKLEYDEVQEYADPETLERYQSLSFRTALSESPDFRWCPSGCGSGQINELGAVEPLTTCLHCSTRFCFVHEVPWHEDLSCEEYDHLLANPEAFRADASGAGAGEPSSISSNAPVEAVDRALAQKLESSELRAFRDLRRLQECTEQEAREAAERVERDVRTRRILEMQRAAAQRRREDEQSGATVKRTTKNCPGCRWPIEKNEGCLHMTCIICGYEFCWSCGQQYDDCLAGGCV